MMFDFLNDDVNSLKIQDMKEILKSIGSFYCLKNKSEYIKKMQKFKDVFTFPWRNEQQEVINNFLNFDKNIYVIHGIFGSGKTTLLLGLLIQGITKALFKPEEILFVSFNLSIKNISICSLIILAVFNLFQYIIFCFDD